MENILNSTNKSLNSLNNPCKKLEIYLFNFINKIRQNPKELENQYFQNNISKITSNKTTPEFIIFNFLKKISKNKKQLLPLKTTPELSKLPREILDYIIKLHKKEDRINYKYFVPKNLTLRNRALSIGSIKGKYYEIIIINSINNIQIINYIINDNKARNILFNDKIKYIAISCDFLKLGKICSVIDIIQDFEKDIFKINSIKSTSNRKTKKNNIITQKINSSYNKEDKRQIKQSKKNINDISISVDDIFYKQNKFQNIIPQTNLSLTLSKNNNNKSFKSIKIYKTSNQKTKINKSNNELKTELNHTVNIAPTTRNSKNKQRLSLSEKIKLLKRINEFKTRNLRKLTPLNHENKAITDDNIERNNISYELTESDKNNTLLKNFQLEKEIKELKLELKYLKQQISSSQKNFQNPNMFSYIQGINQEKIKNPNMIATQNTIINNTKTCRDLSIKTGSSNNSKKNIIYHKCLIKKKIFHKSKDLKTKINKKTENKNKVLYKYSSPTSRRICKLPNLVHFPNSIKILGSNNINNIILNQKNPLNKIIKVPKKSINNGIYVKGNFIFNENLITYDDEIDYVMK